jgi:hypothetical protein
MQDSVLLTRIAVALIAATLVGCSSGPRSWPVKGRVVFSDRSPVASGVVEFAPVGGGPAARGKIDENGRFVLSTGTRPGAAAGEYQVAVVQLVVADGAAAHVSGHKAAHVVPAKYGRFESSGLKFVVQPESNDLEIVIETTTNRQGW